MNLQWFTCCTSEYIDIQTNRPLAHVGDTCDALDTLWKQYKVRNKANIYKKNGPSQAKNVESELKIKICYG